MNPGKKMKARDKRMLLSRRDFLQSGAIVFAGISLTGCQSTGRSPPKLSANDKLNLGVIGTAHRAAELVKRGAIGQVNECHVWCEKSLANSERPTTMPPIPSHIHWDLWLGPAPSRPYHPDYLPKTWRHWWDFGEGILGDMACHYM